MTAVDVAKSVTYRHAGLDDLLDLPPDPECFHLQESSSPSCYVVDVSCPFCGAGVQHVNETPPSEWRRRAVIECTRCLGQYVFEVELIVHRKPRGRTL